MDSNKTERYITQLDSLLQGYNESKHSSTGISPNLAWNNKSTHLHIRENLQKYYDKSTKKSPN